MATQPISIVWFRQDLRLADNPALRAAAQRGAILPIFILDDTNAGDWAMGEASRAWLHHSLKSLDESLQGNLRLFRGDAAKILDNLTRQLPVAAVYWNRCYEPWRIQRDARIKTELREQGIEVESFNGSLLWEPWEVSKADGTPYRVFTPYYQKGCLGAPEPRSPEQVPAKIDYAELNNVSALELDQLELLPAIDWHAKVLANWEIGEAAAARQLERFCDQGLNDYRHGRDFPALESVSRLSPHLHFGELSPNQAWHRVEFEQHHRTGENAEHFLRELGWREFSYHLLYHFPKLPDENFNPRFDSFDWGKDLQDLDRWQQGRTGFPIVDAGMRELWQTGYMHNRVRMIVASFLIKNMLVHWRIGERWFWDCLVDADLASNSASWQWCAGSGADAAPYFRIFNPVLQSEKFDPDGVYLRQHCPELEALPLKYLHKPWQASAGALQEAGIQLGIDYPQPLLDLKMTRERALESYRRLD